MLFPASILRAAYETRHLEEGGCVRSLAATQDLANDEPLLEARPEWADKDAFGADCEEILRHGTSMGLSAEELSQMMEPDAIHSLWTAAEAAQAED